METLKRSRILLALALAVAMSACADKRIAKLEEGITKDSTLKLLSVGAPADDSLPNFYRHLQYFMDSKMFDVYLFDPKNRDYSTDPLVADKELTPIVVVSDTLRGWGWSYMDETSERYKMQVRTVVPKK